MKIGRSLRSDHEIVQTTTEAGQQDRVWSFYAKRYDGDFSADFSEPIGPGVKGDRRATDGRSMRCSPGRLDSLADVYLDG
jgi:hypothetical protein